VTDNVRAFTRPPVYQSTTVRAGLSATFDVFVDRLAEWWPLDPFSYGGSARIARVTVDRCKGGRLIEHWHDGTTHEWGTLLRWNPPLGFTTTWNITGHPTEVELRFTSVGADTLVEVEHRGWDALTLEELSAACALPGGYSGGAFHSGWAIILDGLSRSVARQRGMSTKGRQG
jgi:hypothetical protein